MENEIHSTDRRRKAQILIVDDHPLIRSGLVELVNRQTDMEVCGEADSGRQAIKAVLEQPPDLAVVDLALGDMDGLQVLADIRASHDDVKLVVLSRHDELVYAERALRAGASGYVMKHEGLPTVLKALRCVLAGEVYLSENMQSKLMRKLVGPAQRDNSSTVPALSAREFQVFSMIGRGSGPSQVAKQLHISVKTVDAHQARIKEKLGLSSAAELRACAIEWCRKTDQS